MAETGVLADLLKPSRSKIVLLVLDGLGGLPRPEDGKTELEAAPTPNLDRLAVEGSLGLSQPLLPGLTPGSGPAHLALFGYDPMARPVGRGVLEAIGVGLRVGLGEVAARGNFCTVDAAGRITDRRAGRIPSEAAAPWSNDFARYVWRGPGRRSATFANTASLWCCEGMASTLRWRTPILRLKASHLSRWRPCAPPQ